MWKFPEFLLFGAGEGVDRVYRGGGLKEKELHSAPGTLIFSYGVIGFGFIIYIVAILVLKRGHGVIVLILPVMLYSMFHNTLRQPFLWMLIALLVYAPDSIKALGSIWDRSVDEPSEPGKSSD